MYLTLFLHPVSCVVFFFIGIYGGFVNAGIGLVVMLFLSYFNKMNLVKSNNINNSNLFFAYYVNNIRLIDNV